MADSSKITGYAALKSKREEVSKITAYAVLKSKREEVSKVTAYGVLKGKNAESSKINAYAVMKPSPTARVTKLDAYAVLKPVNVSRASKINVYAVMHSTPNPNADASKINAYAVLFAPEFGVRLPAIIAEPLTGGQPNVRLPLVVVDPVTDGNPNVKLPLIILDPLTGGNPEVRCPLMVVEIVYGLREPVVTASAVFPVMRGLSWSVHKKPEFNTKISDHVSGHEVRSAFYQYPRWEFDLTFEYLPQKDGAKDLEQLMGFFLSRQGKFDAFLFRDPTDYLALTQPVGTGDGGTLRWQVARTFGGFTEIIGQFDLQELFSFATTDVSIGADTVTETAHGLETGYGPVQLTATAGALPAGLAADTNYWIIAATSNTIKLATSPANALAGTAVNITSVGTTGPFVVSNSIAVYDNGTEVSPADYDVTLPNIVEFSVAPDADHVITWSGKYFFVCRFIDDMQDYENFMYNLWTLQNCNFKSTLTVE